MNSSQSTGHPQWNKHTLIPGSKIVQNDLEALPMRRVLIVDDEHLVADTLSLIFQKHGFTTRTVYSADEAMDCARSFAPDLMLCDINMPEKDGLDLISSMDREQPACRILVLTGAYSSLSRVRQHASEVSHAFSVLTKPCQPADLLRCAGELLHTA